MLRLTSPVKIFFTFKEIKNNELRLDQKFITKVSNGKVYSQPILLICARNIRSGQTFVNY